MALGAHWEWRGFGSVPLSLFLNTVGRLPKLFGPNDDGSHDSDRYVWVPDVEVNVKLRENDQLRKYDLKFKRRLDHTADGCELWTERDEETFRFPLEDSAVEFIHRMMNVEPPPDPAFRESPEAFTARMSFFSPVLCLVPVEKHRIQLSCKQGGERLIVELSEIQNPVHVWSVGIEGANLEKEDGTVDAMAQPRSLANVLALRDLLELPGAMKVQGYLELLPAWLKRDTA